MHVIGVNETMTVFEDPCLLSKAIFLESPVPDRFVSILKLV